MGTLVQTPMAGAEIGLNSTAAGVLAAQFVVFNLLSFHRVPGILRPGTVIRINGVIPNFAPRFQIHLQNGETEQPQVVPLLIDVRYQDRVVSRNNVIWNQLGHPETFGGFPFSLSPIGGPFNIVILVTLRSYIVVVNDDYFVDFNHRFPYEAVSHLRISGEVTVTHTSFEGLDNYRVVW